MSEVFASRGPEVLLSGPAGTGKSRAALHTMMLANPGARGLIIRKTLASLGSMGLVTWREKVAANRLVFSRRPTVHAGVRATGPAAKETPARYCRPRRIRNHQSPQALTGTGRRGRP